MINAIVYTSNTGHTKQYAEMLGEKTGLPVYDLKAARRALPEDDGIFYMGWLMAGVVKGYRKARRRYSVKAVCGVGMSATGSQIMDICKTNGITRATRIFCLQGGLEMDKLHGINKMMMGLMRGTIGKAFLGKPNRTPEEDDMVELLFRGGNRVSEENLAGPLEWIEAHRDQ